MIVNKPVVSRWILAFYVGTLVFLVGLAVFLVLLVLQHQVTPLTLALALTPAYVSVVFIFLIRSLLSTRYVLRRECLEVKVSRLVGGSKVIPLKDVLEVKRTLIPLGFRLFGASFHGGYYYVPGLGKAFLAITNFKDGVLIRTKGLCYVITPSKPDEFMSLLKGRVKHG